MSIIRTAFRAARASLAVSVGRMTFTTYHDGKRLLIRYDLSAVQLVVPNLQFSKASRYHKAYVAPTGIDSVSTSKSMDSSVKGAPLQLLILTARKNAS